MASEIKVDTVSEKTSANGVTIDGVNIKDSKITTANSIDSDVYVDGSIDNAHIADDAIDSEHYAAGSIDTAHIADDQITLAKMASGTDGQIITYDASGNPTAVGPGTDGQVLTSTGAGSPPAFEAASGGLTKILTTTVSSNVAAVAFNSTYITSTYDTYLVTMAGMSADVDNPNFGAAFSIDNGSNFISTLGTSYRQAVNSSSAEKATRAYYLITADTEADASKTADGWFYLFNANSTTAYKNVTGMCSGHNSNGNPWCDIGHAQVPTTSAINYLKIYDADGDNIDLGTFTLYGLAK